MTKILKAGALFAGIGGFCLGFKAQGIDTLWAVENDPAAVATYEANIGLGRVLCRDGQPLSIEDVHVAELNLPPVDVLHAGFPCQSFSVAGERKGFADPRGQLFFQIIRLLKEFGEDRPAVVLLENSPNFRIGEGGSWFLEMATQIRKAGYWFRESNAFELDSFDYTEVPQKRRRLFMVAFATNRFRNGQLTEPTKRIGKNRQLSDFINFDGEVDDVYYLHEENRYHQMIRESAEDRRAIYQLRKYFVREKEPDVCPTLTANMGQGGHNVPFVFDKKGLRKLTEYECLALQGFPLSFRFPEGVLRAKRYQQIGNSVVPLLAGKLATSIQTKILSEGAI
jgi:DNA (cytosine-5)-methyltransferase 1